MLIYILTEFKLIFFLKIRSLLMPIFFSWHTNILRHLVTVQSYARQLDILIYRLISLKVGAF